VGQRGRPPQIAYARLLPRAPLPACSPLPPPSPIPTRIEMSIRREIKGRVSHSLSQISRLARARARVKCRSWVCTSVHAVSLSELSVCLVATRDIDNPHVMPLIPGRGNVRFYYTLTRLAPSNVQPLVTLYEDTRRIHSFEEHSRRGSERHRGAGIKIYRRSSN